MAIASALVLSPAAARADDASSLLHLRDGGVDLSVAGGPQSGAGVGGNASLSLDLPQLPVHAQASATTGGTPDHPGLAQNRDTRIDAQWTALAPATVSVSGDDKATIANTMSPTGTDPQTLVTDARTGAAQVSARIAGATVTLGADAQTSATADEARTPLVTTRTHISTETTDAATTATWKIGKDATLSIGVKAQDFSIAWRGTNEGGQRHAYFSPDAQLTLTPWAGAEWRMELARAADPYNDGTYTALAGMAPGAAVPALAPDHAWRTRTSLTQNVGAAKLSASFTQSQSGTALEFASSGSGAIPTSAPLESASEADVSATLPLSVVGLDHVSLSTDGALRDSRVRDPVTGRLREKSGEAPYSAGVKLTQDVAPDLTVGITGGVNGRSEIYLPNEATQIPAGADLGAFLAYKPGSFELDLQADGLAGFRIARNDFYADTRADGPVRNELDRALSGPTLSISLKKPM